MLGELEYIVFLLTDGVDTHISGLCDMLRRQTNTKFKWQDN